MKVWKIIKERRELRAAAQREAREKQDETEGQLGRMLEEGNGRDRSLWERAFGNDGRPKAHQIDSGIGTDEPGHSRKGSGTVTNQSEGDTIEMDNIRAPSIMSGERAGKLGSCPQVTVRVAEEDETSGLGLDNDEAWGEVRSRPSTAQKAPSVKAPSVRAPSISARSAKSASSAKQKQPSLVLAPTQETAETTRPIPGPRIPGLPFKVSEDNDDDQKSERSSVATFAASDHLPSRSSNRLSGGNLLHRLSQHSRKSMTASPSEEALVIPHIDDDRESSVAANVDEIGEAGSSSRSILSKPKSASRSEDQQALGDPLLPGFTEPKDLTLADLPGLSSPNASLNLTPTKRASSTLARNRKTKHPISHPQPYEITSQNLPPK